MIKGYNTLNNQEREIFEQTYQKHYDVQGSEQKKLFEKEKIKEIKVNDEENCIEVYFEHEWFKYYSDFTWG